MAFMVSLLGFMVSLFWIRTPSPVQFHEVSTQVGIDFVHTDGASGQRFLMEILGSGAAFFDYDLDGDMDVYLVNARSVLEPIGDATPTNRLYRNRGDGTFEDVTDQAGVGDPGYGVGCTVGDYNNDGYPDIYITNFGPNVLYRNNGDGTFTEVTGEAGVAGGNLLSSGCAFADIDRDGDLDLFVANYVDYAIDRDIKCEAQGKRVYCNPKIYPGTRDTLYRNNGDGTFTDISEQAGIAHMPPNRGLGVVFGDYDNDGDPDLYVANDMDANYLYQNQGDGTFEEVGLFAGVALSEHGQPEAGMGTDFGDFNNDGWLDLTITNFQNEANTLYENEGDGFFNDVTALRGVLEISYPTLGWGIVFFDYDNDGFKDIFVANGHIQDNIAEFDPRTTYAQQNFLLHNLGGERFEDVASQAGPGLALIKVSRSVAVGDYDNDGDLDLLVTNWNGHVDLLRNDGGNRNHWLKVLTRGTESNRSGVGAQIRVFVGDRLLMEEVQTSGGFAASHDPRVHFGLGQATRVDRIEIRWPSGRVDTYEDLPADVLVIAVEGEGISVETLSPENSSHFD